MSILKSETAGSICGVEGRYFNVIPWGHEEGKRWSGLIANQKWLASRDIEYDGQPATIAVTIRHDDQCKNGNESFSITGEIVARSGKDRWIAGGCLHDDIARYFPELAGLIKWHLCFTDGPLHYVANTVYQAGDRDHNGLRAGEVRQIRNGKTGKPCWRLAATLNGEPISNHEASSMTHNGDAPPDAVPVFTWAPWNRIGEGKARNLKAARESAIWPEATDAELCADPAELIAMLEARLPALIAEFRQMIEGIGFIWSGRTGT